MADSSSPRIDRPAIPAEYGISKASEFVDWSHIEDRLERDKVYWVATVGQGGRPRVRPIDGTYLDDVIILEGEAEVMTGMGNELAERLAEASNAKFPEYGVTPPAVYKTRGAIAIRPRKVITWTDISRDPTRFSFDR